MNPAFLDSMSWEMAEVYGAITDQILINLAHYFPYYKPGTPVPQSTFTYQAAMLAQMGQVNRDTIRIIANGLGGADEALQNVLVQAVIDSVRKAEPGLLRGVMDGVLFPAKTPVVSPQQTRAFQLYYQQASDKLNIVNTVMLESTKSAYQQCVSDVVADIELADRIARTQQALDIAAGETVTGVSTWNQALRHATDRMRDGGIVGFIDHAGHRWSAESYAAMDIRTTVFNTGRAAVWETNQTFGNDLYIVSYHNGARPLCYPWQNRVISSTDNARVTYDLDGNEIQVYAQSDTSYGEAAGLFGINCKHVPNPFIPRVSIVRGEPQDEAENEKTYAESQEQRRLERKLREEKRDIFMAKAQGADEEELSRLREKARNTSQDIDDFCEQTGRTRRRNREGVYTKREFPDADRYDVAKFETEQRDIIRKYYQGGGEQQGYTFGQMTPNVPVTPITPTVTPANVAPQATPTTPTVAKSVTGIRSSKDFGELETYLKNTYNISVDSGVKQLDFNAVREAIAGVENVAAEFPEVMDKITLIKTSGAGVMSCNGTEITFNPKYYKDPQILQDTIDRMVKKKWWVDNTTAATIGSHETGHAVEGLLIQTSGKYTYRFEQVEAWNKGTEAKQIVSQAVKNVKKTPYGKGKLKAELIKGISQYATSDDSETLAEAFADVMGNGTNANPLSQEIFRLTKETYGNYKNGGTP